MARILKIVYDANGIEKDRVNEYYTSYHEAHDALENMRKAALELDSYEDIDYDSFSCVDNEGNKSVYRSLMK